MILRIVLAHQLEYPQVDGTYYLDQARELVGRGQLPHSSFPPGFPLLISLILVVLDLNDPLAPLRAAQTINVVFVSQVGVSMEGVVEGVSIQNNLITAGINGVQCNAVGTLNLTIDIFCPN